MLVFAKRSFTLFEPALSGNLFATGFPTGYLHAILPLFNSPKLFSFIKLAGPMHLASASFLTFAKTIQLVIMHVWRPIDVDLRAPGWNQSRTDQGLLLVIIRKHLQNARPFLSKAHRRPICKTLLKSGV
jgi:hypothetical protein